MQANILTTSWEKYQNETNAYLDCVLLPQGQGPVEWNEQKKDHRRYVYQCARALLRTVNPDQSTPFSRALSLMLSGFLSFETLIGWRISNKPKDYIAEKIEAERRSAGGNKRKQQGQHEKFKGQYEAEIRRHHELALEIGAELYACNLAELDFEIIPYCERLVKNGVLIRMILEAGDYPAVNSEWNGWITKTLRNSSHFPRQAFFLNRRLQSKEIPISLLSCVGVLMKRNQSQYGTMARCIDLSEWKKARDVALDENFALWGKALGYINQWFENLGYFPQSNQFIGYNENGRLVSFFSETIEKVERLILDAEKEREKNMSLDPRYLPNVSCTLDDLKINDIKGAIRGIADESE